jgi:hypothetical protein
MIDESGKLSLKMGGTQTGFSDITVIGDSGHGGAGGFTKKTVPADTSFSHDSISGNRTHLFEIDSMTYTEW